MTNKIRLDLSKPQYDFVFSKAQFPAFVAGYGSGKSHAGIMRALRLKTAYPTLNVGYYLPTYDLVARAAFPRFEEMCEKLHLPYRLNKNEAILSIENAGEVIFRTMDRPERIVAYETGDSITDELDTLKTEKAAEVWHKILGRNRQKKPDGALNTVGNTTTPEGFRFTYERWKKAPAPGYEIIRASTYSNARNLPEGYIDSLKAIYPATLLAAYLDGEFVNLTQGSVYHEFDRTLNATSETMDAQDALHVGMDFNVGKMAAVVFVLRGDDPRAVYEITGLLDTPAMIAAIKSQFQGRRIFVYPDASGQGRRSNNASESDLTLLRAAGFTVLVNGRNPGVKDRVMAVNNMIHSAGQRRFRINPQACPFLVEALEKQAYDKNGEPDKSAGHDHVIDAMGYFIAYRYPIAARPAIITRIGGL